MRKSSKVKKNNIKINSNFFIFQGVIISILLYLTWGSWVKFIILFALEITLYFVFVYYLMSNLAEHRTNTKDVYKKKAYRSMTSNTRELDGFSENDGLRRVGKKNFNWEVSDCSPENQSSSFVEEIPNEINENISGEVKKFVPYRSPFDPIHPKVEEKEAEDKKNEDQDVENKNTKEQRIVYHLEDQKVEFQEIEVVDVFETGSAKEPDPEETMFEMQDESFEEIIPDSQIDLIDEAFLSNLEDENEDSQFEIDTSQSRNMSIGVVERMYEASIQKLSGTKSSKEFTGGISEVNPKIERARCSCDFVEYDTPVELLVKNEVLDYDEEAEAFIEYNAHKLIDTLASFGVGAKVLNVSKGPTVTRYELQPNAGVKVSKIINLADDIALNLAATGVRIEAPIPGKAAVGIEIPNKNNVPVYLRDVIESEAFQEYPSKLAFAVGKDIAGNVVVGDIAKMPHLLIAGATGSGKSVCINTLIISILYKASPAEVRLLMVDPKVVELSIYNGIPHLLIPVVTDPKKASGALTWAVLEMTNRYRLFAENNVRDLSGYNKLIRERGEGETLPQIVIIIDELADLMMVAPNEVEDSICRLAQMARAAGMHLVIATQRPSVNVITGVIKANVPSRISFAVSSQIDSRTILDMSGAEKLLGRGDMLFYPLGQQKPLRVQGSFVSDKEVENIVAHIKSLQSAEYDEEIIQKIDNQNEPAKPDGSGDDELLSQAIMTILELGQASASLIQRKFKVGYSRAARILDQMEAWGVVSASDGSGKPRQILITKQEWLELNE